MGNYEQHVQYGNRAYGLVVIALASAVISGGMNPVLGIILAVASYPMVRMGAAFPDIDHHSSKPYRQFRRGIFVLGVVGTIFFIYTQPVIDISSIYDSLRPHTTIPPTSIVALVTNFMALGVGLVLRAGVAYYQPTHRGITHQIRTGLALSGTISVGTLYAADRLMMPLVPTATVMASAFFVGFLSHLYCDRMLFPSVRSALDRIRWRLERRF